MAKHICVFCGSNFGARPAYASAAVSLANQLVARGITVVYGGSKAGLMGIFADTVLQAGGAVVGVIPRALVDKEVAHKGVSDLRIVGSMHERKALMAELADAFIALPGGYGTFEEFCEVLTWTQLGLQNKACGLLNVNGYYDHLLQLFDHAVAEQFLKPAHREIVLADSIPARLVERVLQYRPATVDKWIVHHPDDMRGLT